eukprot:s1614_g8.t1
MALALVDWTSWKTAAAGFLRSHPRCDVRALTRAERLVLPGAREAWAVLHRGAAADLRAVGAQPCDRCGEWSGCWCEGCERPPRAVCTACDRDHLLCHRCVERGRTWSDVARAEPSTEYIEVSGFHNETGQFIPVDPPVRIPTAQLAHQRDGSFDIEQLMQFVSQGGEAMRLAVAWTNARRASVQRGEPRFWWLLCPPTPHAKEDAVRLQKLDQLFQLVLTHILDLKELGVTLEQLQDPMELQRFKDAMMGGASRLSVQRLGALTAAFRRWLRYCNARGVQPGAPSPLVLADFLREVSAGGPTAASSMHASLKWFSASFGAAFPVDHWTTKHFRFHAVHHTGRQMPELQPWELINLVVLMKKSQGTHRVLVAQMLMAALGCIRFEHLQRSSFVTAHGPSLEFSCSQGKARKQGARPGYNWGLPHLTLDGQGPTQTLRDFYANEFPSSCSFLLPAIELQPDEFWEITEHTPLVTNRPMSRARFLELLRGALFQVGVEFGQAQAAGFNRLRRFLPTMANVMEMSDLDLQAVGNWVEIPSGSGRDPAVKKARASMPMGVHYAASKDDGAIEVEPGALDSVEGASAVPEPPTAVDQSDSSSDSSSSASDVSAEGADLVGILADDTAAEELLWIRQGKKVHAIREDVDGRATPWCRDFPFVQEPQARGRGFTSPNPSDFCARCLGRMPRGLYLSLAEHNNWVI